MKKSIHCPFLSVIGCLLIMLIFVTASFTLRQEKEDIEMLARKIAGKSGNTLERAR